MDVKLIKQVDTLYRNMKPMPALALVGVIIPLILLFAAPLGLVYAGQRSRLLKRINMADPPADPWIAEQVEYIREHNCRLYVPLIVIALEAGLFILVVLGNNP